MHWIPCALDCGAYLLVWWEEGGFCVEHLSVFPLPFPSLLSTVHQCDQCLSSQGHGVHGWVVRFCQPSVQSISILELATNNNYYCGSSRMSQAPNLHLVTQLLICALPFFLLFFLAGNSWLEKLSSCLPYWHSDPKLSYYNSCGIHSFVLDNHTALC